MFKFANLCMLFSADLLSAMVVAQAIVYQATSHGAWVGSHHCIVVIQRQKEPPPCRVETSLRYVELVSPELIR